ncbi:cytochrome c [Magnetospira sp. QH-2]|uniref:c-type cytochrome n=1 Tax=Magnetospira sp. (strain QH-2) TaxID=1288970 RepID=UPI0003E80D1F|nr:cytochrome c [Magnetospira sp. QH-2]CCQ74300.1 Putative Cytochrome c prime [Magnetospira sp. QH-2]
MSVKFLRLPLAALAVMMLTATAASADTMKQIENRQAFFKAVKVHMGALVGVAKGAPYSGETKLHAQGMLALAMQAPRMFPEGSDMGETGALPGIWEKPEDFKKALAAFLAGAEMAVKADGGSMAAAVGALGKSCKGCHDTFREKHKH